MLTVRPLLRLRMQNGPNVRIVLYLIEYLECFVCSLHRGEICRYIVLLMVLRIVPFELLGLLASGLWVVHLVVSCEWCPHLCMSFVGLWCYVVVWLVWLSLWHLSGLPYFRSPSDPLWLPRIHVQPFSCLCPTDLGLCCVFQTVSLP